MSVSSHCSGQCWSQIFQTNLLKVSVTEKIASLCVEPRKRKRERDNDGNKKIAGEILIDSALARPTWFRTRSLVLEREKKRRQQKRERRGKKDKIKG